MWVVDTCVIIDILSGDGEFSTKSATTTICNAAKRSPKDKGYVKEFNEQNRLCGILCE